MSKKVIITGATGLIGSHLTKKLVDLGYEVIVFTRNPEDSKKILPAASEHVEWRIGKNKDWEKYINGAFAVINLAGAPIAGKRWNEKYKQAIRDSRIHGTRELSLAMAAAKEKPKVFISASAIGYYGDSGDKELYEDSSAGNDFLAKVCYEWEEEAKKSPDSIRTVLARIGVVLSDEDGALPQMMTPIKLFVGGKLGNGKQWFPWIHIDDITEMFIWSLENEAVEGAVNFVAPEPVTNEEFTKEAASVAKRPAIFTVPEFAIKIILGEAASFILSSFKVIPKFAENNNFSFKYPKVREALIDLIK